MLKRLIYINIDMRKNQIESIESFKELAKAMKAAKELSWLSLNTNNSKNKLTDDGIKLLIGAFSKSKKLTSLHLYAQ